MNSVIAITCMLIGVIISSFIQIILKKYASNKEYQGINKIINVGVIVSYGLFFLITIINVFLFKYIDLSVASVIDSLSLVFVPIIASILLKEKINKHKVIGIIFIIVGVLFVII